MAITINGTTGIAGVDGSASTPAVQGTDTNTGVFYPAADTVGVSTGGSERMRIDSSGRVLINKTSTDGGQLNVQNSSTTTRAYVNATLRNSRTASTHYSVVSWNGSLVADAWIGQVPSTDALCFGFDAGTTISESMRLATSGELLIGTTTTSGYGNGGGGVLITSSSATNANNYFKATSTSYAESLVIFDSQTTAGTGYNFLFAKAGSGGVAQFKVSGNGIIYAQNTTVQSISDVRLKENIKNSDEGLNVITALRPVRYDWKEGYGNDRKNQLGFIAQEVEDVFPDAVSEWQGINDSDDTVYKTVGPASLIPVLVKAIQEQQALIQQLQADVAALKGTP